MCVCVCVCVCVFVCLSSVVFVEVLGLLKKFSGSVDDVLFLRVVYIYIVCL